MELAHAPARARQRAARPTVPRWRWPRPAPRSTAFERLQAARHADAAAAVLRSLGVRAPTAPARRRAPDQARGRGARPARPRAVEPRDLRAALHQPQDRRAPRRQHPGQARPAQPGRGRRLRRPGRNQPPNRGAPRSAVGRIGVMVDAPPSRRTRDDRQYDAIVVGARCAGVADRDAAGPQGLPGAGGRPGDVPERHPVDAHHPRAGRRRAAALGAARPGHRDRLPAGRHLLVRLRPVHDRRHARARRRHLHRRTRRGARCSTRSSSTPPPTPAPRCARASPSTRSSSRTAPSSASAATARTAQSVVERARVVIGADGRNSQVAQGRAARAVQREADAAVELLHLLERPARRRLRDRHPSRPGLGRRCRRTTG